MITVYSAPNCPPCQEIEERIHDKQIGGRPVEVGDVETDDGFKQFTEQLTRSDCKTFNIPSVFVDDKECSLRINGEDLVLSCGV